MGEDQFYDKLVSSLEFEPTRGQEKFFHAFMKFIFSDKERCALIMRGYAGTGKTTCLAAVTKSLSSIRWKSVLLAPTGRAAKVLGLYSKRSAYTIHKKIYRKKTTKNIDLVFSLAQNLHKNTLFIVDEASMISGKGENAEGSVFHSGNLLDDLIEYVYSGVNCKLIFVGDGAQLPPVKSLESPALNPDMLRRDYNLTIARIDLTEVVRQSLDSGILWNATQIRNQIRQDTGHFPKLNEIEFDDIENLGGHDVQEYIEDAYNKYTRDNTIIITRSNKRANYFNAHIRSQILGHEDEINGGDTMMVVKNNYYWMEKMENTTTDFIANGDIIEVIQVRNYKERYGFKYVDAVIKFKDYPELEEMTVKLILDAIWEDGPNLSYEKSKHLYQEIRNEYLDLKTKQLIHKAVIEDPFYNALQVKFAYAITCHKAQGGQWPVVMIDQGYLTEDMLGEDYLRWLYTAFTRASEHLYLLQFKEEFF